MAISYVGGQVAGRANPATALSVNFALAGGSDATPSVGDLIIVAAVTGSAGGTPAMAVTTPAGYTALTQQDQSATTSDTSMNVSYKIATSGDTTAVTIPGTGNNAFAEAYSIQVFRGVDGTTPMDATAVATGATGTGRPNPAAITPVTAGAWVVICGGGAAGTGANYVAPANFTTNFLTASGADTTDAMIGSGYWTGWVSGAVDPAVYTGGTTGATDSWAAYTLALRPAATASDIAGSTVQSITPVATLAGSGALAGASAVSITPVAVMSGAGALAGSAACTLTPAAALAGAAPIAGACALAVGNSGEMSAVIALAGTSALAVSASATVTGAGELAGAAAVSVSPVATLAGSGDLAGASPLTVGNAAAVTGAGALVGAAAAQIIVAGALDQPAGALAGAGAMTLSSSATLTAQGALAGICAAAFEDIATLGAAGALVGAAAISVSVSAAPDLPGGMTGTASLTFSSQGVLLAVVFGARGGVSSGSAVRRPAHDEVGRPRTRQTSTRSSVQTGRR